MCCGDLFYVHFSKLFSISCFPMQFLMILIKFITHNADEKLNAKAEAWEKAFIETVKNWDINANISSKNETLQLAYTSERSIKDEIAKSSESQVITVLLSYLLMFAYIAIGLGQMKSMSRILVSSIVSFPSLIS